ncbi:MAG: molybdopterin-dependent oxidoreductase [Desulfobacterales bacterium]
MVATGMSQPDESVAIVPTGCSNHCGGACLLRVHVKDGKITRIETDNGDQPQIRACLRGRAYRQRVYAPDRLQYPMRRTGERGEGKFERISWDEALDAVAGELNRVKETYGPAAILYVSGGGDLSMLHNWKTVHRLLCMHGGCSMMWGYASNEGATYASMATYGHPAGGSTQDDLPNSQTIILWGTNPAVTIQGAGTSFFLAKAREAGARIISVDPYYTESAAICADQWIPIRPGTDTAMLVAMAHVLIEKGLADQHFLDTYTVGFDRFKEYVLGDEDGVAKTPDWAETITGVSADTIRDLAIEYATRKPAALLDGWAAGRTAYGEQFHRAAITLAAMTGNIGISGGNAPGSLSAAAMTFRVPYPISSGGGNPIERGSSPRKYALPPGAPGTRIHNSDIADAILKGKSGGFPEDYKFLYLNSNNFLNQFPNTNKAMEAFRKLDFIVAHEQFMTPTAKFADILLPTSTFMERNDMASSGQHTAFVVYMNKLIAPLHESKSHLDICTGLAEKLGIDGYSGKTDEEWLRDAVSKSPGMGDYDSLRKKGLQKSTLAEPHVGFKHQIEDPENNPFPTPSGKIEIYSQQLADMNHPKIPPIPKYIETWEGLTDPLAKTYPLQFISIHSKRRAHSQFDNIPLLKETEPQQLWINPIDAKPRGINQGDTVEVFNDRGKVIISARLTERIMPGVVNLSEGAWFAPDENGADRGGNPNTLTKDDYSPGGAFASNTALVQVGKH